MAKKSKLESITLAELSNRYIAHMEESGKSAGTAFSYLMELKLAQSELGGETLLSALTPEAIASFNTSRRVMLLKSGRSKSQLSIDKSRRVLRLALTWAHRTGLLAEPLVDAKHDVLPTPITPDVTVVANDRVVTQGAPKSKRRARKLAVPQQEAEAVANETEAAITDQSAA